MDDRAAVALHGAGLGPVPALRRDGAAAVLAARRNTAAVTARVVDPPGVAGAGVTVVRWKRLTWRGML